MKNIIRLFSLLRPYQYWMIAGFGLSFITILAGIILMGAAGWFITAMGLAGIAGITMNYFTPAAIIRACAIVRTAGRYGERLLTHEVTFRLIAGLRVWLYQKLLTVPFDPLSKLRSGDILTRLRGDIDTLERFYLGALLPASIALLSAIFLCGVFAFYNLYLSLVIGLCAAIALLGIPLLTWAITHRYEQQIINARSNLRSILNEQIQGLSELIIYDREKQFEKNIFDLNEHIETLNYKTQMMQNYAQAIMMLISQIALIATLYLGSYLFGNGDMQATDIPLLLLLCMASFEAITPMALLPPHLSATARAAERIFGLTDQAIEQNNSSTSPKHGKKSTIIFDNVLFGYTNSKKAIFDKLSLKIETGKNIFICGPSGAGKTTLIKLLLGQACAQSGKITINNHNITPQISQEIFSYAEQSPYIFARSIRNNLTLGNPDISDETIMKACAAVYMNDYIQSLPDGLNTYIGEHGATLSGGQIKRLAIARALLKPAPFILLDEPTEGLDFAMEKDIFKNILEYITPQQSLIVISHRLISNAQFDTIKL